VRRFARAAVAGYLSSLGVATIAMINVIVVLVIGLAAGAILGIISGFSMASHRDVLLGMKPRTTNRLVLFLARPANDLNFSHGLLFLLLLVAWIATFFALVAAPAIAASRLGDGSPLILFAYAAGAVGWWRGRRFGASIWDALL